MKAYYEIRPTFPIDDTCLDLCPAGWVFRVVSTDAGRATHADSLTNDPRHPRGNSVGDANFACYHAGIGHGCDCDARYAPLP